MSYILALDAGTGSVRSVLFDLKGNQVGVSQVEWTHLSDEKYPGSMDFDYNNNWKIVVNCIKSLLTESRIDPKDIKAISATSMREGFVLYDKNGIEIWACANVDSRAYEEVTYLKNLDSNLEQKIYEISGQTFALGALPRLLWLKNNKPDLYEQAASISMINDWILYKLSGKLNVDPSNGCTTGIFDLRKRNWTSVATDLCGIKSSLFPPVKEAGTIIGYVTDEAAIQTGLTPGIPVISGGGDAQMASVGVGAVNNYETVISGGSFWQQEVNIDTPITDPECRIRVNCHSVPNLWQIETIAFFPGLIMRWFRDAFCDSEKEEAILTGRDPYEILEEKAKDVPVGSNGIIPIFSDVMNYISWRHASPSFINLSLDPLKTGKKELFKSLQENAALVTFGNLKLIEEVTGFFPTKVIFAGGASKGKLWSQTLADVLGVPVKVPVIKEAAALGTALFAGVGVGIYSDIKEAVKSAVKWERTHYPNMSNHTEYLKIFERWKNLYKEQLRLADNGLTTHMWKSPGL
ncbi:autoinducer-2 kinase [Parageobacillus thermoglucosidasius]|uniref:autoinducer-2 kinase n=1 Tax=Parageobacillus thermoglucosidasius TaxID=1426 RepID=UPI0027F17D8A|nr:autoinducer-2 kinase [Parageobacillus thermoglucosidasius]MED4913800.1 autoinducer-2 kinase [Parageobacillus thermoglucosidasius]MED4946131.1 autoinducer-2 kinase [Parageobacillus thermoglucosidasius]MED4984010.1 autoinducer-2 kinase [Parageobacillus thermoglucosidasius]GMO01238.1 autoinducer-2 kinase [Parageobacillus thermoglucosidasius]